MKKEKLAIIGANEFQNKLIEKAKDEGYETHVFAWKNGDIGEKTADFFYPISIIEKEEILKKCMEIKPVGICSIGSDLAVPTVNYIAEKMGLIGNDSVCSLVATDKYEMRKTFIENNLPSPKFVLFKGNEEIDLSLFRFPLIVKPTDRSGSRGVTKIKDKEGLAKAIEHAQDVSFNNKVIIEEFVEGTEYSIEYISYKGNHKFMAATRKYTTGEPHFIETAHYQPAIIDDNVLLKIKKTLESALDVLHIKSGASHAEVMVTDDDNIMIIEIGARMGGDCIGSDLVKISTGYDYVEMVIAISCGKPLKLFKCREPKIAFIKFIMSKRDIEKYKEIKGTMSVNVYEENLKEDQFNAAIDCCSSADRPGYYILELSTVDELQDICGQTIADQMIC